MNGIVYVPYSGYFGDCGSYHGWVVGVDINNPVHATRGRQRRLAAEYGDTAALPVTALTCSSLRGTRFTRHGKLGGWRSNHSLASRTNLERSAHRLLGADQLVHAR